MGNKDRKKMSVEEAEQNQVYEKGEKNREKEREREEDEVILA